jgi:triacylglycerol esterase/lipase EstA (alpha/beta hydrolase family)
MSRTAIRAALLACLALATPPALADRGAREPVVLLHGLARTAASMERLAQELEAAGYPVCNVDYPSRQHAIETLARDHVAPAIRGCFPGHDGPVNFVTHSMGGLVVREIVAAQVMPVARVVMLSPPNHGSEAAALLGDLWLFRRIAGPAGQQLRPVPAATDSPSLSFELGVLTGNRTFNPWMSLMLPGDDDGKVTVASARLSGMRDFRVLPVSHPFIMRDREAIQEVLFFLEHGHFEATLPPLAITAQRKKAA